SLHLLLLFTLTLLPSLSLFPATATTEIHTLSLHDALPIYEWAERLGPSQGVRRVPRSHGDRAHQARRHRQGRRRARDLRHPATPDRKSTRLNSSHVKISYAVFCLKKKNTTKIENST